MAGRYTDVDLMILKRWDEVSALREAFDDLLGRIGDVVEGSLQKVSTTLSERGLSSDSNRKRPSIWFWKRDWATKRNEPGVYLEVFDFAPSDYGRDVEDHPSMWVKTDEFSRLKLRESTEDFGRALRSSLSTELRSKWSHEDADLSEWPLGRDCIDVTESDRVAMVGNSDALGKFIINRVDELMELVPAIDQTLSKMTRR